MRTYWKYRQSRKSFFTIKIDLINQNRCLVKDFMICYNCCRPGHTPKDCSSPLQQWAKCAENHSTMECTLTDPLKVKCCKCLRSKSASSPHRATNIFRRRARKSASDHVFQKTIRGGKQKAGSNCKGSIVLQKATIHTKKLFVFTKRLLYNRKQKW